MNNAINWFELPAQDFDRAVTFYDAILGEPLRRGEFMGILHGFFPSDEQGVGGAVIFNQDYQPSDKGALIYLNANKDMDGIISRVVAAIGEQGFIAWVRDTEGNKIGLHTEK